MTDFKETERFKRAMKALHPPLGVWRVTFVKKFYERLETYWSKYQACSVCKAVQGEPCYKANSVQKYPSFTQAKHKTRLKIDQSRLKTDTMTSEEL